MSDMRADALVKERERDFERLLTFVDAIVAIAITLLVLPWPTRRVSSGEEGPRPTSWVTTRAGSGRSSSASW